MKQLSQIALSLFALALLPAACSNQIAGDLDPDQAEDPSPDPTPPPVCDEVVNLEFEQEQVTPDILLVMDKSGSMGVPLVENGPVKWDTMKGAVSTLLTQKGSQAKFGLMMFPWVDGCSVGQVRVAPNDATQGGIATEMNSSSANPDPGDLTPTHTSLQQARAFYSTRPANEDGRIVILATDGLPNCGPAGPQDPSLTESVAAIEGLLQDDIQTYVLGFGIGNAGQPQLQQMANAGGTDGTVYNASSPEQLSAALDEIVGAVTIGSCDFALQQTPQNDEQLNVTFGGNQLERNGENGWTYDAATNTVTLLGETCESVKAAGGGGIEVDLGCDGVVLD